MLLSAGMVPGERRSAMLSWTKVRVAGPLAPYAPGFGRELRGWGYTDLSTAEEELLGRYRACLVEERGLVPAVVSQYLKAAALFVDDYPGAVTGQRALDAAAVSAFCARELPRRGRASAADL